MKPYELLIFDWDGTLMDSADELVGVMQHAIQETGLPERTPAQIRELIGLGFHDVLARLFPDIETWRVRARLHRYRQIYGQRYGQRYGLARGRTQLFVSVSDTLSVLQEQGFALAVATGKSRRGLDAAIAEAGIGRFFRVTRCADESAPKPAPDLVNDILLRSGTPPENTLVIGDTEYDMAMACAAGVDAVGVACGVHDGARLRRAGALDVLQSIAFLPDWLAAAMPALVEQV